MQTRRGFLRTLFGTAAAVAMGGLGKVAEAITTKPSVAKAAAMTGFASSELLESGYFFAPYIPLYNVPVFNAKDFAKEVASRYDGRAVVEEYYGGVLLKNL